MTFAASIETLAVSAASATPKTIEATLAAMTAAAVAKGEFPSSLSLVEKLRLEVGSDAARPERVSDLLSTCPVMAMRVVATANSAFYSRGNPVETTAAAVNHLGIRRLQTIIEDLAQKKSFQATLLGRATAASALQRTIVANILSGGFARLMGGRGANLHERAHSLSCLLRLPSLMLAFTRPNLYSALELESLADPKAAFDRSFKKAMGESISGVAVAIAESLSFPIQTTKMVSYLDVPPWNRRGGAEDLKDARMLALAVSLGQRLSDEICRFSGTQALEAAILDLSDKANLAPKDVRAVVGDVPQKFLECCDLLGFKPSRLPSALSSYQTVMVGSDGKEIPDKYKYPSIAERINPYLYELKACLNTRAKEDEFTYVPQAALCTLKALVKGLNFDRAVFFRYDEQSGVLRPELIFGVRPLDNYLAPRPLLGPETLHMPDVQACVQRKAMFFGDPVFAEDWPLAAFPVICQKKVEGVFFADKVAKRNAAPLETQEQVAIVALAEGWHDVSPDFR